jgi:AraC family transcriptional regulator
MKSNWKPAIADNYRLAESPIPPNMSPSHHGTSAVRTFGSPIADSRGQAGSSPGIRKVHLLTARELLAPSLAADTMSMYFEKASSPGPEVRATIAVATRRDGTNANTPLAHSHNTWTTRRGLSRRVLALACTYMEAKLGENFTLDELARAAGVSRFHFSRLFRVSTGASPMGYFLYLRVERAKNMLLQGDRKICEIALALGFFDQSHFSRTFRRMTGVAPREYVRLCDVAEVAV